MLRIVTPSDCGNSPKILYVREFIIALSQRHFDYVLSCLDDNINWDFIGRKSSWGKEAVAEAFQDDTLQDLAEINIKTIISHGKQAMAEGTLELSNGQAAWFCHTLTFSSHAKDAKIAAINSYIIYPQA